MDIDQQNNPDLQAKRQALIDDKYTYSVFTSTGGYGLAVLFRKREGMPFIEGGDTFLTPLNMVDSNNPDTGNAITDNNTANAPQGQ